MATGPLLAPKKLYRRSEVLARPCPVPAQPGIYAWYFRDPPAQVPLDGTHEYQGHYLLYVGIAPRKPTATRKPSTRTLRDRIRGQHYSLNAEGSTLRLTLGCLLSLELRRIASQKHLGTARRMTFGKKGEQRLNEWMENHAFVVWNPSQQPWILETELLTRLVLPLNLDANANSSFYAELKAIRAAARERARALDPLEG